MGLERREWELLNFPSSDMARQKRQMAKKMNLVRESLIASEGVLPSDKEVTAVLEAIEKGKKSLSPGKQ